MILFTLFIDAIFTDMGRFTFRALHFDFLHSYLYYATPEMLGSDFLSPKTIDVAAKFQVKEGLNYKAGNGCEWYVRVEQATWERLLGYRNRVGTATIDGAIKRMLESIENSPP